MIYPFRDKPCRDYQRAAANAVVASLKSGAARRVLVTMPTGAGKSRTAAEIAWRAHQAGRPVLALCHRREIKAQLHAWMPWAAVATIQSPESGWVHTEHTKDAIVIVDEAHHLPAGQTWFDKLGPWKGNPMVGLTATPERADGQGLGDVFDKLIVGTTYPDLIAAGYLVDADVISPQAVADGSACKPVEAYTRHAAGRSGFAFFKRVSHAVEAAEAFNAAGIPAAAIHGGMRKDERQQAIAEFQAGAIRMLCNCNILTEGFDAPRASVVLFCRERPYGHASQYMQAVGRVLRPHPEKDRALVLDLDGNVLRHGLPTEHRTFSLDGEGCTPKSRAAGISVCQVCGHTFESGPQFCPNCQEARTTDGQPLKIYSRELLSVYAGNKTEQAAKEREAARLVELCDARGWSFSWAAKKYKAMFSEDLPQSVYTDENKANELCRLYARQREKGYKQGYPLARYHATFGHWPPRTNRRTEGTYWHD